MAPTESSIPITVAVVEDRPEVRDALVALLDGTPGFCCTGSYGSMEAALRDLANRLPRVALIDLGLPGMSGIDGIRALRSAHPDLLSVALTVHDDDARIFDALCAGASGYLLKGTRPGRLLESIQDVATGGAPMSPEVARRVVTLFRNIRPPARAKYDLTPHEQRLLGLLADGLTYKDAAATLDVSVNTIAFHIRNIYDKLQVHSAHEAVARALREGLIR